METSEKQPTPDAVAVVTVETETKPTAAPIPAPVAPVASMEAEDVQMTTETGETENAETSRTSTPQVPNGNNSATAVEDDEATNEDPLSPPPKSMSSGPANNVAEDEIVVGTVKTNGHHMSPARRGSDDDVDMEDAKGNRPKRKRMSTYNDLDDSKLDGTDYDDSTIATGTPAGSKMKAYGASATNNSVTVGYWRESPEELEKDKHVCVAFIDTRDRLRTRLHRLTRDGRPIAKETVPTGPGGSWVTFDRIVFDDHLIGLDHNEVKEYVKIRREQIDNGETSEQEAENGLVAVRIAKQRVKDNPPPETPNGTQIAYGKEIPEHAIVTRPENKRRRLMGPPGGPASNPGTPQPAQDNAAVRASAPPTPVPASRYPLDPLTGTRPTRILLGYWSGSDEVEELDKHAVYGILGLNDMFRVKVTRETRDGRNVIGNFPTGAGALWINYDDVVLEPHLKQLNRAEIKEYTRVRQRQLDDGETAEQRVQNETTAVFEAQRRVGVHSQGGEIRPPPPAILPTNGVRAGSDDPDYPINSVRPKRASTAVALPIPMEQTPGPSAVANNVNRPELRQRAARFPPADAVEPVNRSPVLSSSTLPNRRATGGPAPVAVGIEPIRREPAAPSAMPLQQLPMAQPYSTDLYAQRGNALAAQGLDSLERATMRTRQREASRDSTPQGSFIGDSINSSASFLPGGMNNNLSGGAAMNRSIGSGQGIANTPATQAIMAGRQRLQNVWVGQETTRIRAQGSDDEKLYNGVKYERKQTGPFAGKLTSQGNIITIDGVDYVEYRILMVPSFS